MFFEGGGYKSRAVCHGARTVRTEKGNAKKRVMPLCAVIFQVIIWTLVLYTSI